MFRTPVWPLVLKSRSCLFRISATNRFELVLLIIFVHNCSQHVLKLFGNTSLECLQTHVSVLMLTRLKRERRAVLYTNTVNRIIFSNGGVILKKITFMVSVMDNHAKRLHINCCDNHWTSVDIPLRLLVWQHWCLSLNVATSRLCIGFNGEVRKCIIQWLAKWFACLTDYFMVKRDFITTV